MKSENEVTGGNLSSPEEAERPPLVLPRDVVPRHSWTNTLRSISLTLIQDVYPSNDWLSLQQSFQISELPLILGISWIREPQICRYIVEVSPSSS